MYVVGLQHSEPDVLKHSLLTYTLFVVGALAL